MYRYLFLLSSLIVWAPAFSAEDIGVIYPVVREPYSQVYKDIIKGIEIKLPKRVTEYPVNGKFSTLYNSINDPNTKPDILIALGNKSLRATNGIDKPIFAAITKLPAQHTLKGAIILKPSAKAYLSKLISIYPTVSTVHVVYNIETQNILIKDAEQYLKNENKLFNAIGASNIRESARGFLTIVEEANIGDAIWLMAESDLVDSSILALILDIAWKKRLAVFSSNPEFVKRGVLFAIFPDNIGLGEELANMVQKFEQDKDPTSTVEYLETVKTAYNDRTGNHIGIKLSTESRNSIDIFMPDY